jgi:uncharacterized protein (TIGR02145 family)
MKKLITIAIVFCFSTFTFAQDITISFQPKVSGTTIDSIWVTNQKTNQKVILLGNESLVLTKTTGIIVLPANNENGNLYPNPCNGDAFLSFSTSVNQEVELRVYNNSGQMLSYKQQYLTTGQHRFQIHFPITGIYSVSVLKNDGPLSFKGVCFGNKLQECKFNYSGSEYSKQLKSAAAGKTLSYTQGDILLYSVFSSKNNTILTDLPTKNKAIDVEFYECFDADKQNYSIVKIGNQWWMAENLAYLPSVSTPYLESDSIPYYYVHGVDYNYVTAAKATASYIKYGVLYNWPAALQACPTGWHLPSDNEWKQMEMVLGMTQTEADKTGNRGTDQGSLMKAPSGWYNNENNPNTSGFSGLPGGYRFGMGHFTSTGADGEWWSSTKADKYGSWYRLLMAGQSTVFRSSGMGFSVGFSVRCVRNL